MLADANLGENVNLKPGIDPQDIYINVVNQIESKIKTIANISIDRSMVKKVVMTIPYNAGLTTTTSYFVAGLDYDADRGVYYLPSGDNSPESCVALDYKTLFQIGKLIHSEFFSIHPVVEDFVNYLNQMAKILTALGLSVS